MAQTTRLGYATISKHTKFSCRVRAALGFAVQPLFLRPKRIVVLDHSQCKTLHHISVQLGLILVPETPDSLAEQPQIKLDTARSEKPGKVSDHGALFVFGTSQSQS
jgi:hypothetical protein